MTGSARPPTLLDALGEHAARLPQAAALTWLSDRGATDTLTYEQLTTRAYAVAERLRQSTAPGDRVLLLFGPGLDFVWGFLGCLWAGVVAVPAYPPRNKKHHPRLDAILQDAEPRCLLVGQTGASKLDEWLSGAPPIERIDTSSIDFSINGQRSAIYEPRPADLALLQYTSGSTSAPKGVMVTHANLAHNSEALRQAFHLGAHSVSVSWLPSFHDMGLVDGVLQPLYTGFPAYLMAPSTFIQRPATWLEAISRYGATHCGGPNFGFEACIQGVTDAQMDGLDLSRWETAYNGAEPVRRETLDAFAAKFARCGFTPKQFFPCYGLAEGTLIVTGPKVDVEPIIAPDELGRLFVGCGSPVLDTDVLIVDGEICVKGPSVASGYWNRPEATAETFGRGYLRTGDLGFFKDDELFVAGRIKDLVIVRGRNHYPQDLEATASASLSSLGRSPAAAFSVEHQGEERLVVVQEVPRTEVRKIDAAAVIGAIRTAIVDEHDVDPWDIVLVPALSLPKTSSGKLQRGESRRRFLAGEFKDIARLRASSATLSGSPEQATVRRATLSGSLDVASWIRNALAKLLGIGIDQIDMTKPFASFGVDSITAVRLSGELQEWLGRPVPPTVAYDYPTIDKLAAHLSRGPERAAPHTGAKKTDADEPIAIVGIGCRVPGARGPEEFWRLLRDGIDGISDVPAGRWSADHFDPEPGRAGKLYSTRGGFLDEIDAFDAAFFGISPNEADRMDPQQRMLLETVWEAFEDAGIPPPALEGTETGVFVGISTSDYRSLQFSSPGQIDHLAGTGNAASISANRISYLLDLQGPSIAVDTACSSSLLSIHLACESLRRGECTVAVAGGVNLMLSPELTVAFSQARMLSPDGRCKSFDAGADGYVRGEGCGMVVLKPLSDAVRDGDRIAAVILATATNQDGRTNGLTAPNGLSQQRVLGKALERSGLAPSDIQYVEAHGTGTPLGDPIEMQALCAVYGKDRAATQPLYVGSVKTNIGHLEAAAGVMAVIKTALALRARTIPAHLHFARLNPAIDLGAVPVHIPTTSVAWPDTDRPAAGVSSFGFGGTNVHALLATGDTAGLKAGTSLQACRPLLLSAKSDVALRSLAERYRDQLRADPGTSLDDLGFTALGGRARFAHRLGVAGGDASDVANALNGWLQSPATANASVTRPRIAFLYTGQGSQYAGMGAGLYRTEPVFRDVIDRCAAFMRARYDVDLVSLITDTSAETDKALAETRFTQPALYALECALTSLWRSWGVEPDAVIGHSVGEFAAAWAAGVFELEDGLALIAERGRLMHERCERGAMAAVFATLDRVEPLARAAGVEIAAYNTPGQIVVSGTPDAVAQFVSECERAELAPFPLATTRAFHSALMDPALPDLERAAASVSARPPRVLWVSNVSGEVMTQAPDAAYWRTHARVPVRFADGVRALDAQHIDIFVEIGPSPVLLSMARRIVDAGSRHWLPSLERNDERQIANSVAALHVAGIDFDARALFPTARRIAAPAYPFARERHWFAAAPPAQSPVETSNAQVYEVAWERLATRPSTTRPSPEELRRDIATREAALRAASGMTGYPAALAALDGAAVEFARTALARVPDEGVAPRHRRLANRLRSIVATRSAGPNTTPLRELREIASQYPEIAHEARILERCGSRLADVLTGAVDPLHLLFPGGDLGAAASLYSDAAVAQLMNGQAALALEHYLQSRDRRDRVRILEVGAGTGGLTTHLLPVIAAWGGDCDYIFTDVSPLFLEQARGRFAAYPFVEYRLLDVEHAADAARERCDLVIAANAVHAVARLTPVLGSIHAMLRPGGQLWLLEGVRPQVWLDLTFGLTDGWWKAADGDGRADYPLLSVDRWASMLESCGFTSTTDLSASADVAPYALVAALRPKPEHVLLRLEAAPTTDPQVAEAQAIELSSKMIAALRGLPRDSQSRLWVVTRGARGGAINPASVLWGLGKTAALEFPDHWGGLIDLDPDGDPAEDAAALAAELSDPSNEDQQIWRRDGRWVPRLSAAALTTAPWPEPRGGVLITGGTGALGLQAALGLARSGYRHLYLMSRTARTPAALDELRGLGAAVHVVAGDAANPSDVDRLLLAMDLDGVTLQGIVHAAGVPHAKPLLECGAADLDAVYRAKVRAPLVLLDRTRQRAPEFFVLFSSMVSLWGAKGQGVYAAGNHFLDDFAAACTKAGTRALSINWGPVSGGGMVPADALARVTSMGVRPLPLASIGRLLTRVSPSVSQAAIVDIDWNRFRAHFETRTPKPFFSRVGTRPIETPAAAQVRLKPDTTNAAAHIADLEGFIRGEIAAILGYAHADRVDPHRGFFEIGLDSLTIIQLKARLEKALGIALPATIALEYPTVTALARHLNPSAAPLVKAATSTAAATDEPIAIVGIGCRFPGGVADVDSFWTLLRDGVDAVGPLPANRWDDGPALTGGFLDRVDMFDAGFFGVSAREASKMDPQHRLLLHVAFDAMEDGGAVFERSAGANVGVFVGVSASDYSRRLTTNGDWQDIDAYYATGNAANAAAGRVSYLFGFRGPAMAIDTACSSSLVAIRLACQSLRSGDCDAALAGGVNLILSPETTASLNKANVLSPNGRCRAFDATADGMGRAEGCGLVLLKPLSRAIADHDRIYSVIRSAVVNQDGASGGFTVPSRDAQESLIRQALERADVPASSIDYIEAHGTGTPLGDPIEARALAAVFADSHSREHPLRIGSVKTNFGHTESASGVAGLIKTALSLHRDEIAPQIHFEQPSPHIDWAHLPLQVVTRRTAWPRGERPRRAGVSSFGLSGTNAHVLLEEAPVMRSRVADRTREFPIVVSAKTDAALTARRRQLAAFLRANPDVDLRDVAYTLSARRLPLPFSWTAMATSMVDAVRKLDDLSLPGADTSATDWPHFWRGREGRVVGLPAYPFEYKSYWKDVLHHAPVAAAAQEEMATERADVQTEVVQIVARLLEEDPSAIDPARPFLEMGADSIVLMEAIKTIERRFGVEISIRQMFETLTNIQALAAYVAAHAVVSHQSPVASQSSVAGAGANRTNRTNPEPGTRNQEPDGWQQSVAQIQQQLDALKTQMSGAAVPMPAPAATAEPGSTNFWKAEAPERAPLTPAQQAHLDQLVARYVAKTRGSKASEEADRPVFADMRTAIGFRIDTKEMSYPIVAARSHGAAFWDIDGNQYVDMCMGFGVAFFGHQPSFVVRAIEQQLHDGIQVGPQSKDAAEVARLVCELTGMERVTFCNSGTEAVMTAIRIARAATGKQRIVTFTGSYHGHSDATLALAKNAGRNPVSVPMAPGVSPDAVKDTLVLPWDLAKSLEIIEANAGSLAAVLVEPVQSRRPGLHPKEFLRALRDLTARHGIPLIFDEMITGFRIHPGGAQAHFGVEADIVTYGKLIGGGMPLGVVAARGRFLDRIDGGQWQYGDNSYPAVERTFYAGTFCKHPLSMAAARAVLTELVRRGPALQDGLNKTTADFVASVNAIFGEEHVPLNIVNFGSLMRFNVAGNFTYLYQPLEMDLFCHHLIERGIYIWEGRTLFLSTEHTQADLDAIRRAVRESVREMKAGGFFAGPSTRLPLTEAQRDLWVLAQMGADGANAYQETIAVEVHGAIDRTHLEAAARWLVERHEALRIAIDPDGSEQEIRSDAVVDVRFDNDEEPFDLQHGPLFRVRSWPVENGHTVVALYSHHIIADGWTMGMLIEELSAAYGAFKDGRRPELPPAPRYSDYLNARAARLESAPAQTHRQYWKDVLSAPLPALDLPLDHPRPPVKTFGAFRVVSPLPDTMHASLKTLSASHGCTMFMTLLAGYVALLHRLAGAPSDIIVGMPVSGRVDQDDATVAGFCTHILPVRLRIDGEWTFSELLHRVRKAVLDAFDHQDWPFGRMLDDVDVEADLSRTPVFTTTFNLDRPLKLSSFGGISATLVPLPARFTTYDLACNVVIDGGNVIVSCDGNRDLWEPATAERWVAHYRNLLQAAAANATLTIEELPLLDETARKRVLADWNNTNEPLPHVATLHQWIEEQAERTPDAEAVRCGSEGFTYAQLNARAEQLAGSLRAHGVGRGDLVGVSLPRRFDLIATLFAVLKTGAAYVPLDPRFPVARLRRMITHSGMRVVFTDADTQTAIEPALEKMPQAVELLRVDDVHGWRAMDTAHRMPSSDDTAYVMYTSASTGEPKGVVITHRSVINLLSSMARRLEPTSADAWLAVTTVSFDISVLEIFLPLVSGFRLVLGDDETSRDGRLIAEAIAREQITLLQMTPAGWRLLLESGWTGEPALKMVCGGEALPIELARTLAPKGRVLWNVYGPTETTIWSTAGIVDVDALTGRSSVPIGQPLANTQLYVLDGNGHVQPTGVPGELFIGGAGLAVGYHRDEMITLERFLPNPLGGPSPRLYRTGDLARWLPGGSMEFLGRLDQQVKIRGFRIELGEIDAWLSRYPGIAEAVAHVRQDASGEQRLIAYYTVLPGATPDEDDVRRHLADHLPEYMVPNVVTELDAMPRTPNGKIDRRSLPAVAPVQASPVSSAPLTPTEQAIALVWQEMLQRPQVGADDDFLALGGNSLLAARLVTRLGAAFQITLTLRALLEHRTVRRMAQLVESIQWAAASRKPAGASDEQVEITL